jgi:thiamine pyrophosphate-dependent acetolactate synthase large subunit-like protein
MSEDQTTTLTTLAIKHALVERGVSHLSVPNDLQKLPCDAKILPMPGRIPNRSVSPGDHLIQQAATVIDRARRPVVIAGFGALGQGDKLLQLARTISAPIVTTFRGKGVIDGGDELYVGSHGTIGSTAAARLVRDSDLLIVVGSSFSDMTQIPAKSIVQIDIDPIMIAKSYPVEIGLWGSSSEVLPRLTGAVTASQKATYLDEIAQLKKEWLTMLDKEADSSRTPIRPQFIIKVLNDTIASDAVVSLDVGENGWWFGRNFSMKQTQRMVMSGYLASMGVGLPGALAGQIAFPGRQVICITGDGGFSMVMGDFMTAVKYNLPVKVFVLNNRQLGMIAQEQKVENYTNWQTDLHNCDFAEYARSCGGAGINVEDPGRLKDSVNEALAVEGPVIVDVDTDPKRFV